MIVIFKIHKESVVTGTDIVMLFQLLESQWSERLQGGQC